MINVAFKWTDSFQILRTEPRQRERWHIRSQFYKFSLKSLKKIPGNLIYFNPNCKISSNIFIIKSMFIHLHFWNLVKWKLELKLDKNEWPCIFFLQNRSEKLFFYFSLNFFVLISPSRKKCYFWRRSFWILSDLPSGEIFCLVDIKKESHLLKKVVFVSKIDSWFD